MTPLATGFVVVWLGGLLLLAGLYMNDMRVVFNNVSQESHVDTNSLQPPPAYVVAAFLLSPLDIVAAAASFLFGRTSRQNRINLGLIGAIDPDSLSETGRAHLQRAFRHEWFLLAWSVGGFILLVWWLS